MIGSFFVTMMVCSNCAATVLSMVCSDQPFFPFRSVSSLSIVNKANVLQIDLLTVDEMRELVNRFPRVDFHYLTNNQW